jgi:hypothetical protein
MHASVRLVLAAKGAVLWVLLACLLGIVPALIEPSDATLSILWVAAAMGLAGAVGHIAVSLAKPHPEHMRSTALATAALSSFLSLALAYWFVGMPSVHEQGAIWQEALRASVYVILPMVVLSFAVLRLVAARSAA